MRLDDSHRGDLTSWVESAASPDTDFPVQNLPLGRFCVGEQASRPGIAIGDDILDLAAASDERLVSDDLAALVRRCMDEQALNPILAAGPDALGRLRHEVSLLLRAGTGQGELARAARARLLVPLTHADLLLPTRVGDYTDFYASIVHATNVGSMFRPDNPLLPNYKYVPIGYHGRASSIVPSGTAVRRPEGQSREDPSAPPLFGPTSRLDYEMEVGVVIGSGSQLGSPIPISDAERRVAGLCLVNDWSARDIQSWEYQPLGPFLAKNFATTM